MPAQHIPQIDIDSAEEAVAATGKPKELTVSNVRRIGILLLRLRPSQQGVVGSWTIRYQEGDARPTIPLGSYSKKNLHGLSLEFAKQQFDAWIAKREEGIHLVKPRGRVAHELKTREQLAPVPKHLTVRALVDVYLDQYAAKVNTATTVRSNRYMFNAHLDKLGFGAKRARDVTVADVQAVVDEIVKEGSPAQAERFRATIRAIWNMAAKAAKGTGRAAIPKAAMAEFGIVRLDEFKDMDPVENAQVARKEPMQADLLPLIYDALSLVRKDTGGRPTAPLLRATLRLSLLLGGTRFEQINRLEPEDFDFGKRRVVLTDIKGHRRSGGARKYKLPLTDTAVQVAKEMLAERDKGYKLGLAVFGSGMKRAMQRAGIYDGKKQGRDVRSTIATWWNMEEQGVRREVQNYVQSHGQMIEDRHYIEGGAMEQEIRRALEKLENLLIGRPELKEAA